MFYYNLRLSIDNKKELIYSKHISCYFVALALFIFIVFTINFVYAYNRQHETGEIGIEFKEGGTIDLEFDLKIDCLYYIGIGFSSKYPTSNKVRHRHVKEFFQGLLNLDLPAEIDIKILNDNQDVLLDIKSFGGKEIGYIYGPDPVKFIAKTLHLKSGIYYAQIKPKNLNKNFKDFEAFFFVTGVPKTGCGDKYWWPSN